MMIKMSGNSGGSKLVVLKGKGDRGQPILRIGIGDIALKLWYKRSPINSDFKLCSITCCVVRRKISLSPSYGDSLSVCS